MERRFVVFLLLTFLIWGGFIGIQYLLPEPAPVVQKDKPGDKKKKDAKADAPGGEATDDANDESAAKQDDADKPEPGDEPPPPQVADKSPGPEQRWTLGGLNKAGPYRMLVTFNSRGAAVERVELIGYQSVEDLSGYLGHLALVDVPEGGAKVQIVGPGTPAALAKATQGGIAAGLQPDDVIKEINGQPVAGAAGIERLLAEKTRPGDAVKLGIERAGQQGIVEFTAALTRRPLEVVRPEPHTYETDEGRTQFYPADPLSLLVTLDSIGGRTLKSGESEITGLPSLHESNWTLESEGADFIEFSYLLTSADLARIKKTGELKIRKRYSIAKSEKPGAAAYHLDLQVTIENLADKSQTVAYRLDGPTGLPLEGWWYSTKLHQDMFAGAGARDVVFWQEDNGHELVGGPLIYSEAKAAIEDKEPPVVSILAGDQAATFKYAGVDTQFFASAILPQAAENQEPPRFRSAVAVPAQDVMAIPKKRSRTLDVTVQLTTATATLKPNGGSLTHNYQVFFGPKDPDVLGSYELEQLIEYGWPIFKWPAVLLQHLLAVIYSFARNYGIAIILLTVLVRSCMIPISLKQARNAAKMQELAPEMQKIREKYPDDQMKQHAAIQELYKKHNFNVLGGCLPMFLQLPIFIGLYRCLSVDIDLRDASLIPGISWASNLAGPDKLFFWKDWLPGFLADETGWLGPFFNVLPLITIVLFLLQQKMFMPPATDDQTKMQQQMMTYMTVFMGVLFYKVPAGLCVYFITSSLWGICERKLLPKPKPKSGDSGTPALPQAKPASPNGYAKPSASKKKKQRQR